MNNYFFSIVIPSYNCQDFIRRTLDSIVQQREPNLEVVICDDSSIDNTQLIVNQYKTKLNINLFTRPAQNYKNHCPANTRREGLKKATGKWVIFLDHDDIIPPGALQKAKELILQGTGEEVFIEGKYSTLFEDGKTQEQDKNITRLQGKVYKRDFLNKHNINFYPDQMGDEDLYFNSLVYGHIVGNDSKIISTTSVLQYWRYREKSFSQSFASKKRNYLQQYFGNYVFANLDGWLECYRCYPHKKDYYFERAISSAIYYYFYYQGFLFKNGNDQLPQNFLYLAQAYDKICKTFNLTKKDLVKQVYKDSRRYNAIRENSYLQDVGYLIERYSFIDFIKIVFKYLEDKKGGN